jgi:hypothetical protein
MATKGDEYLYGLMAEFDGPDALVEAARKVRQAGYRVTDSFCPYPVDGLSQAMGLKRSRIPAIVLTGGIVGGLGGYFMEWYANVVAYPWNIGGRPHNSWPAFIPITFECTVLIASFASLIGMLALNGLPLPYHPVFNIERFVKHASRDGFFLAIESADPKFKLDDTRAFLQGLGATHVTEVPR